MTALFAGMIRRNVIELRRYGFDTVMNMVGLALLFVLVFYGAKGLGGRSLQHATTLTGLVAGYFVFSLVIVAYSSLSSWVTNEALLGTLEQIAMSPFGTLVVLVTEFAAGLLYQLVMITFLIVLGMALTGHWLHFDLVTLVPLVAILLTGVLGLGLAMAGAALVFKRVLSLLNLMQFALLALVAAPVDRQPWTRFLPISLASRLIARSTVDRVRIWHMGGRDLLLAVAVSVGYFALGAFVFSRADRAARKHGLIGVH